MRLSKTTAVVGAVLTLLLRAADSGDLSLDQWRHDLQFFARELPKRHINPYHHTTREQFEAAVADLNRKLADMDYDQAATGFMRLAAMIGDAHTNVQFPTGSGRIFPLVLREFEGQYRVIAVGPGFEKALGTRLLRIGDMPVEQACQLLSSLDAQDEHPWLRRALAANELISSRLLHGVGIIADDHSARYAFAGDDGQEFTLELTAQTVESAQARWVTLVKQLAYSWESMHRPNDTFAYTYFAPAQTVYCNIRSVRDLDKPVKELLDFVKERKADRLVIDLRQNPGGDYFEGLRHLIEPVEKISMLNRKGHLFVLIGPLTGSAAMVNAVQFHRQTAALLVGEAIGAKPTSYAERRQMELPNSHLVVSYSVKYYEFAYNTENIVRPDQEVKPSWAAYRTGHDPTLDWIFEYPAN